MNNKDKELWQIATSGVQKLDQKQTLSQKDLPVFSSKPKEVLTYDLHGMTVQQAFDHTLRLCTRAYNQQRQSIVVVTGKSGRIKEEFDAWMSHPRFREFVRHARVLPNGGSFTVYLHRD